MRKENTAKKMEGERNEYEKSVKLKRKKKEKKKNEYYFREALRFLLVV